MCLHWVCLLLDWFKWLIVHISMLFYDQILIWDDLCCLFSIKVIECFCCIHVSWRCSMMHGAVWIHFWVVPFSWWVFPQYFPRCSFEVCRSAFDVTGHPLWLCGSNLQVRLFVLSVCLCVWVFWPVMIHFFILELVSQFSILLHSAACLSWMWLCRFQPCRSLPSLVEKFCKFIVFVGLDN